MTPRLAFRPLRQRCKHNSERRAASCPRATRAISLQVHKGLPARASRTLAVAPHGQTSTTPCRSTPPPALRQPFGRCADLGARAAQTTSFRKLETLAPPPQTILALEAESEPLPAPAPALGRPCGVLGGAVRGSHLAARPVVQVSFRRLGSGCARCSHAHARSRSRCPWLLTGRAAASACPPRGARSQRRRDGIPKW